ncbi:4-hydroxy-tetrahydrodipicolinate synthase [Porphyromonas levii]|uniref:4-hydroxy-tetrahydrodipicolinate synthase n=1 Tax=Porphyromonas levii TaxID=28114 RepID=UPI001B8B5C6A|nr:4-hydroxy-tetrahydrodipicolinate synthase [Porphyromonas levii]MBR8712569.1 4-hydroxy-tetrahydrodipicolinate synthase [Porphyromonas levii]MBR8714561.1 4-hydroxy-tetrahydrodipicolinate synthase [Porphyromonas levii]MBR8727158.1 4-hydroxy-tetrahydrodipicolinate synthase [Porphyromonas levii]MBR8735501.1 4-hydroxy-tetrahydrodipicolinate synthase [Porphyromonas levii]MBR8777565.1 4-hydroxy-tetrahydrodipicolinate synthase [Porphyromonas levii]
MSNKRERLFLKGMGTAIVTPFKQDKSVDYNTLEALVERQIECGADFLVVLGTTAETPTLSTAEQDVIIHTCVKVNNGRVPLVVGASSNGTLRTIDRLKTMPTEGVDAVLVVCPYYNKPSQEGLFQHFKAVSEASPLPVILYNVPARTAVNMLPATTLRLATECPNIIGIKEASGIVGQIDLVSKQRPKDFFVLAGDDTITFPLMAMGVDGVISVIGNVFPKQFGCMVHLMQEKRYEEALVIHHFFKELYGLLFVDGNPVGVKCAMAQLGLLEEVLRLPLVEMQSPNREKMVEEMKLLCASEIIKGE